MLGPLVIGIGNPDRGDDGIGPSVARRLKGVVPDGVEVMQRAGEPAALVEAMCDRTAVWLIDAAEAGDPPGTIRRYAVGTRALPARMRTASSHGVGLAEAVELARTLHLLPAHSVVLTVEGASFAIGAGLSPEVEAAGRALVDRLAAELRPFARRGRVEEAACR